MATRTPNDTSDAPDWRQLCQVAFFELDPKNCFNGSQRHATPFLTESKTAIQDQRTAKDMRCARRWQCSTLQKIAQRDPDVQKKTGT